MFGGFNFGGFGHHDDDDHEEQQIDNKRYYEIMQVSPDASQQDIKKSYLRLAKLYHPDRNGGSTEKFQQLNEANQTLSDQEKRKNYDKYGTKGKSNNQEDILNMFFGGGRGAPSKRELPKVKPTKKALEVTLDKIYNGELMKIPHKKTRCCQACKGKGGKNVSECKTCKGRGQVIQMYQMGPGMYQQVQKRCDTCKGEGQIIGQGGKCKTCNGVKIVQKQCIVEVAIQKGIPNNHVITLNGQGNQIPDALAGDLIFIVQEQPHQFFTRKGADLFMKKNITLVESLTGVEFSFKHLDGIQHVITTGKGQVLADQQKKVIRGLGMPFYKDAMSHGNLIIEFTVQMPKRGEVSKQQLEALAAILPGKINSRPQNNGYEMMEDFDPQHINSNEEGGRKPKEQQDEQNEGENIRGCQAQ